MIIFKAPEVLKVASVWAVWMCIAVGALGWSLFVVLDAFGVKNQAAAWVQALGGIAAVFAAFYVGNKQARDAANARSKRDQVVFLLVCGVAQRAASVSSLLFQSFTTIQTATESEVLQILSAVEEQLMAMRGINPVELPLPEMVEPFLIIRGALEESVVFARLLSAGGGNVDSLRCATVFSYNSQKIGIASRVLSVLKME